jgi:hypothetical protein
MASPDDPPSIAMFAEAQNQSLEGSEFRVAGNNMYTSTFNFHITPPNSTVLTDHLTPQARLPSDHTRGQRQSWLAQLISRFFRAAGHRDVINHGSQVDRAIRIVPAVSQAQASTNASTGTGQAGVDSEPPQRDVSIVSPLSYSVGFTSLDFDT